MVQPNKGLYQGHTLLLKILFVPELACMHGYLFEVEFSGLHTLIQVCTLIFQAKKIVSAHLIMTHTALPCIVRHAL